MQLKVSVMYCINLRVLCNSPAGLNQDQRQSTDRPSAKNTWSDRPVCSESEQPQHEGEQIVLNAGTEDPFVR